MIPALAAFLLAASASAADKAAPAARAPSYKAPAIAYSVCENLGEGSACNFHSRRGLEIGTCVEILQRVVCLPDDAPRPKAGGGYTIDLGEIPVRKALPKRKPEPRPEPQPEPAKIEPKPEVSTAAAAAVPSTAPASIPVSTESAVAVSSAPVEPAPPVKAAAEPPAPPSEGFPYGAAAGALVLGAGLLALLRFAARPHGETAPAAPPPAPADAKTAVIPESQPTTAPTARMIPAPAPKTPPRLGPNGGKIIGAGYEIRRELGAGGMGVVHEALDSRLDRRVALKQMRAEIGLDGRGKERFLAEAKLVARLQDPHIVAIHDVVSEGEDLYLVLEYVDGETLDGLLDREKRLPPEKALPIIKGVAEAVDYAHGMKVIHRDLKPANIMIDKSGKAKVMDFGIAHEAKLTISKLTMAEAFGTLAYMPPEQELGRAVRESDVYSLAALSYETLTGLLPFPGPNFHLQKETMSFTRPSGTYPPLPAKLDPVFEKAFQVEPKNRYSTAGEFAAALAAAFS